MFFKKFIITIFASISFILLFVFMIRISTGKMKVERVEDESTHRVSYTFKGFLGVNDLSNYVSSVNFNKPLKDLYSDINDVKNKWDVALGNKKGVPITWSGGLTDLNDMYKNNQDSKDSFTTILDTLDAIFTTLTFPFKLVYDVLVMIIEYFKIFFNFLSWLSISDGFTSTTIL